MPENNGSTSQPLTATSPEAERRVWLILMMAGLALVILVIGVRSYTNRLAETPLTEATEPEITAAPERSPRGELPAGEPVTVIIPPQRPTTPLQPSGRVTPEGPVGIHAFPPPGTRPQLTGIIVPEDFDLPAGYIRHYQSSDDGQMLEPILMFDPVRPPLDEHGQPMKIPPDRVVPPEMAPAGLPIRILEIPERQDPHASELRRLLRSG